MKSIVYASLALLLAACSAGNKKPMESPKDQLLGQLHSYAE